MQLNKYFSAGILAIAWVFFMPTQARWQLVPLHKM